MGFRGLGVLFLSMAVSGFRVGFGLFGWLTA